MKPHTLHITLKEQEEEEGEEEQYQRAICTMC